MTAKKSPAKKRTPKPQKAAGEASQSTKPYNGAANLRPWQPGQSGNPGGRPAVVREVRDLAREHTADAFNTLLSVCQDAGAPPAARVAAAAHILDRGYGKPTQTVNATVNHVKQMTDEQLLAFLAGTHDAHGGDRTPETPLN